MNNVSLFELIYPTYKIKKPVRLIELFAGVGSQAGNSIVVDVLERIFEQMR